MLSVNYRAVMGSTNPKEAAPGTLRADFAESIDANAVHGSDSPESAKGKLTISLANEVKL